MEHKIKMSLVLRKKRENLLDKASFDVCLPCCRVPYYSTIKLAFLVWLQAPRYSGALRLSAEFIRPFLWHTHASIDAALSAVHHALNRPEFLALAASMNDALAHVPVLEWFVRGPDGRPVSGRSRRAGSPPPGSAGFITGR